MTNAVPHTAPDREARLRALVEEVLQGSDLFLVELSLRGRKGAQVLDVFVDSDTPLDVERLAEVSRALGFLLDAEDVIPGRYSLNVSSPGVTRPLRLPRQFRKNVGRILDVKYRLAELEPVQRARGELIGADEEGIELQVKKEERLSLRYPQIEEARVQLPW